MQDFLNTVALNLNQQLGHQTSVTELHGEDGFYIDLDLFNYTFGGSDEFVLFELLISSDGKCRSISVQYCEVYLVASHDCWDSFRIPTSSFDLMTLLKHVEESSKEDKSLIVDLVALRKVERKVKEMITFFQDALRSYTSM